MRFELNKESVKVAKRVISRGKPVYIIDNENNKIRVIGFIVHLSGAITPRNIAGNPIAIDHNATYMIEC